MDPGLYIAASGMLADQVRQDQLSNDLANGSTPGYKADYSEQQSFGAMLLANTATGQPIGTLNTGVRISRTLTDTTPAPLYSTGRPLDFGIAGAGFFAVRTPQGVRYTRDGQFTTDAAGRLVDGSGDPVLSQAGAPITAGAKRAVAAGAIGVFTVTNVAKQGNSLLTGTVAAGRATGVVRSGQLESSGTDPVTTMVDMIASLRAYESGQKAIQSIDETMQTAATQVGSLGGG